jgi:hypothetical protein
MSIFLGSNRKQRGKFYEKKIVEGKRFVILSTLSTRSSGEKNFPSVRHKRLISCPIPQTGQN